MITVRQLHDKSQTADEMYSLVERFSSDLNKFDAQGIPLARLSFPVFFNIVSMLPYERDELGVEVVTRPFHILDAPWDGWDCKKKAILLASWLRENGIPFRFVAVSKKSTGRIHHVIVEAKTTDAGWKELDATYNHNYLGERQTWTNKEVLSGESEGSVASPVLVSMYGDGEPGGELSSSFLSTLQGYYPEYMGIEPGAVVTLIVGIVAAVTSATIAIVQAVSNRRERERAEAFTAKQVQTSYDLQTKLIAQGADIETAKRTQQMEMVKGMILPAALAAGVILFVM